MQKTESCNYWQVLCQLHKVKSLNFLKKDLDKCTQTRFLVLLIFLCALKSPSIPRPQAKFRLFWGWKWNISKFCRRART